MAFFKNLKDGAVVGVGFFIGYYLMRIVGLLVFTAILSVAMCTVCAPNIESIDRKIVMPIEHKLGVDIVDIEHVSYPNGCFARSRPTVRSKKIGQVIPGKAYMVYGFTKNRKWRQLKIRGKPAWVGCKAVSSFNKEPKALEI